MRNKTFISSMVGVAAAVAVAGSANASVVVDPFTAGQTVTSNKTTNGPGQSQNSAPSVSGSWLGFTTRELTASNGASSSTTTASATTSIGGSAWTLSVSGANSNKYAEAAYYSEVDLNLSDYTSWTLNLAFSGNRSTSTSSNFISMGFGDSTVDAGFVALQESIAGSASSLSVTFNRADFNNGDQSVDWSKITSMSVRVQLAGSATNTVTVTDFTATAVPAPGAIALLGAAGLIGARRRRD